MKERDIFQKYREQKPRFSLKTRMVFGFAAIFFLSIVISFGIASVLKKIWPFSTSIPLLIQISLFSMLISTVATYFFSKIFLDPIMELRKGMQKIADGKFTTRLETHSTSSEIRELTAGFNMMAEELESTEILQSDFVSNVSHEFRTPINAIEGYSTLLQGCENLDGDQKQYVEKILFNTGRLSTLVSNILLLSKIENQSIQTKKERFSLDEQIRETIVALETAWEPKNIEFDIELDTAKYNGSEIMLRHVWSNLISNAIKFSPRESTISIKLENKTDKYIFTVSDQGEGLSDEAKKHLFDKFYQADTSHKSEGNGLGLALAKRILTIEGGSITAENIDGGGCRFTVILKDNKEKE